MRLWFVVFLLAVPLALSGCLRDDAPDLAPGGAARTVDADGDAGDRQEVPLRFSPDEPQVLTMSATGSVANTDNCFPVNCLVGDHDAYQRPVDVSGVVPLGVPVRVEARVYTEDEVSAIYAGFFRPAGATIYQQIEEDGVAWVVAARTRPSDVLEFVVEALFPEPGTESEWHLQVDAITIPDHVPAYALTGLEIPDPSHPPRITREDGELTVSLWAPDDSFLGHFTEHDAYQQAVRDFGRAGTFVLMPYTPVSLVANTTSATSAALAPLARVVEEGPIHTLDSPGEAEWEIPLQNVPVNVRLVLRGVTPSWYVAYRIELTDPDNEVVMSSEGACGVCIGGGGASGNTGVMPPGTYTARAAVTGGGFEAQHYIIRYER